MAQSTANFNVSNSIAVLSACINPLWTLQTDGTSADAAYTGAPPNAGAGVNVAGSVTAQWAVFLRPRATATLPAGGMDGRQLLLTVDVVDDTADYTVTFDGTSVTYSASTGDDATAILEGLATEIIADGTLNALVAASVASEQLTIIGRTTADYTISFATTGTGALVGVADATNAEMSFWSRGVAGPTNNTQSGYGQQWSLMGGVTGVSLTWKGWTDVMAVNGNAFVWIELYDVVGAGDVAPSSPNTLTYAARVVIGPSQP